MCSTFSNCHVLFRYQHSFKSARIVALGTTIAQRACNAVRVIDRLPCNQFWCCQLTGPLLWATNVDYHQCCWRHRVLLILRAIMDANHRGGWTQRFQTAKDLKRSHDPKHIPFWGNLSCVHQYPTVSIRIRNLNCLASPIPKIWLGAKIQKQFMWPWPRPVYWWFVS